jgi:hypothetical protein
MLKERAAWKNKEDTRKFEHMLRILIHSGIYVAHTLRIYTHTIYTYI